MKTVEAVVLDWAGTVVDFGSVAPTTIFVEAMKQAFDFDISLDEARVPMGMGKWDHIKTLGQLPEVKARWIEKFGAEMSDEQVDFIYQTFMPLQKAKVGDRAAPIAGALDAIETLRQQGIKIGSCSGYPKEVMDILVIAAAEYGYKPDCYVSSDEMAAGSRPGPWMALENVNRLGIKAVSHCVKVDDSVPGIEEGLNAGMWTVGIAVTGNAIGLTEEEWLPLDDEQKQQLKQRAVEQLTAGGAHYVIDSLAQLPQVIEQINTRLVAGERP